MPLDNSLNVSELLRRLGVKGDSKGSAPLLESLRLNLMIGDLSDLVPPVGVPFGAAALGALSGAATFNQWNLHCRAPGGLTLRSLATNNSTDFFHMWVSDTDPFGAVSATAADNFSFSQPVQSIFQAHLAGAAVVPLGSFLFHGVNLPIFGSGNFDTWIGPGEFLNIEAENPNNLEIMSISWKEYPAALNP